MNSNSGQKIRSLLAMAGGDMRLIEKSYKEGESGDYSGNRNRPNSQIIEDADYTIRQRMGMIPTSTMQPHPIMNYPSYPNEVQYMNYPTPVINQPRPSREERLNKLLGKTTVSQPITTQVQSDEFTTILEAVKEALVPVTEQLEDIAVLNGLLVQRIEKLIKVVDPNATFDEQSSEQHTFPTEEFEMEQSMEVYDPEVSMSLTDDEDDVSETTNKKKKRKTTK